MAAGAQDGASLVDGSIQLAAYPVGFSRNPDAGMLPELLKIRADRDGDKIVAALPQRLALLLCHPNHTVQLPFDSDLLVQGIHARKQRVDDIGADHGYVRTIVHVVFIQPAAGRQINVEDGAVRRSETTYPRITNRLLTVFHVPIGVEGRSPDQHAVRASLSHRMVILHGEVLAFLAFQELINIRDDRTDFADDENVGAEIENLLGYVAIDSVDKRYNGNHRRNSNHHPE